MTSFVRRPRQAASAKFDLDNSAIRQPDAASLRQDLLTGVCRASLVLNPAAALARWVFAFARAARAFFRSRLRSAAARRSAATNAREIAAGRRTRAGLLGALAFFGLAWTVTPAAAGAIAAASDYSTSGDVTIDPTGNGTTTVGSDQNPGSLEITGAATGAYTTGTLDVAPSIPGNSGVSSVIVDQGATLNDDAIVGDGGTATFTNNGTHNVTGNLILGNQSTGNGTYTITGDGSQTTASGALIVGNSGTGVFTQGTSADFGDTTAPSVAVVGGAVIGNASGSTGTYNQVAGTAAFGTPQIPDLANPGNNLPGVEGDVVIGASGQGTYTLGDATQQAPVANVYGSVIIGQNAGSNPNTTPDVPGSTAANPNLVIQGNGALNVYYNGGTSNANPQSSNLFVGLNGNGAVTQTDGSTVYTDGAVVIGANSGGVGSYDLTASGNGAPTLNVGQNLDIGGIQEIPNGAIGDFQSPGPGTPGGVGSLNQSGGTVNVVTDVNIGNQGGTGTYNLSSNAYGVGSLTANTINLGNDNGGGAGGGTGTFNQSGGSSVATNNLLVGNAVGGTGAYTITGDGSQVNVNFAGTAGNPPPQTPNGALIVGNYGTGTFTQGTSGAVGDLTGPSVNVAGDLSLGRFSGSQGTYTINDGTLTVGGGLYVGQASTADNQFIQNGGTVNITGSAGGDSRYTSLNAWAPTITNAGSLVIGGDNPFDNGTGTYTINDGPAASPSILTANFISIGYSGTGTFNQYGGSVTTNGIDMGDCGGCNGSSAAGFYNLTGDGQLTVNGGVSVGDFGYGYFTQNGTSTNTITGTLSIGNGALPTPQSPADPTIPFYNRSGTYELDAGTLSTQYTVVGSQGLGTFTQTGGAHNVQNTLTIGQQNSQPLSGPEGSGSLDNPVFGGPAPGIYNMSGGTLTAGGDQSTGNDTSGAGVIVGDAGNGTFNQTGGSVTSGSGVTAQRGDLIISAQAGSTGAYNIGQTGASPTAPPTLQVYGDAVLGRDGAGSVTVPDGLNDGGTVTVPLAASNGTLAIAGNGTSVSINQTQCCNSIYGGNLIVGFNGTGAVTQTDQSTVYMDHNLVLGANSDGSGSYTLSATSITNGANSGYNLTVGSDLDIGGVQTGIVPAARQHPDPERRIGRVHPELGRRLCGRRRQRRQQRRDRKSERRRRHADGRLRPASRREQQRRRRGRHGNRHPDRRSRDRRQQQRRLVAAVFLERGRHQQFRGHDDGHVRYQREQHADGLRQRRFWREPGRNRQSDDRNGIRFADGRHSCDRQRRRQPDHRRRRLRQPDREQRHAQHRLRPPDRRQRRGRGQSIGRRGHGGRRLPVRPDRFWHKLLHHQQRFPDQWRHLGRPAGHGPGPGAVQSIRRHGHRERHALCRQPERQRGLRAVGRRDAEYGHHERRK